MYISTNTSAELVALSTNTWVELVALWSLLYFATCLGLPSLMVWEISQVVINWENTKVGLNVLDWVH